MSSGCHVAVGDVAPGGRSLTWGGHFVLER